MPPSVKAEWIIPGGVTGVRYDSANHNDNEGLIGVDNKNSFFMHCFESTVL